ncbi:conserved oligomeric Golgi complex subunit 1 isoform X2 [Eupeodes corollae]|uniref:conserved oligomeric Golgi complex subunit 1 isoform X2 n=1 Tax=Eupeodes corollae TaxID=290404 RepID=UPI00248F95C0|nr:conserved oligomeric Golgi complex subunit 1 isoform X2 [Eupeodes corollae]
MSSANLANLNVDALFEQHSIAEIDIVQKKIQTEVEKKREELRTMVGERYRDLLKAADTIATMRESSSELCNQIEYITTNCRSLNEKQLIGFKTDTDAIKSRSTNKQLNNYFSTVVQIKLLTTLPEMIWSHIDNERFYLATELFIFSRHISTGLQLDVNNTLMQYFPVAKKQWEILKPFHLTIKQSVLSTLEREELSPEAATDCLLSLLLLEKGNLNGILKTFVQLRCSAFLSSMINEGGDQKRVKDRILGSLRVINSTVQLVHKCFFENNKGLVCQKLEELEDAMPTITHVDCHDSQFAHLLPDIIANFRPKFDSLTLNEEQVKTTIENWLNDSSNIAGIHLKTLFNLVSSMKIIQEIKKDSIAARKQDPSWGYICERFGIAQKLDFYEFQYKPLINQRIRDIIRQSWIKANEGLFKRIEKVLLAKNQQNNNDLWLESSADLPMSLKDALSDDKRIKKLLMKSKGFDGEMISICSEFNDHLAAIVCEMNLLLDEQETKADEKLSLVEFLKETSEEQIRELMAKMKNDANCDKQLQQLLFLVRLLAAIIELCPNLRACLSQSYHDPTSWASQPVAEKKTLENWTRVCNLLEDEGFVMWKSVCRLILEENPVEHMMTPRIGHKTILEDFANWETVTIEQKDEQDQPVQSTFRIPSQPRISLQQYLFSITSALNFYIPQTLPQKVLYVFNSQLIQGLLQHYKSLISGDKFTASSQNTALQLYYDVKFLQSVFSSRDDRSTVDEFQSITNLLKEFIDPFDFELFSEHISMNVKKSVTKMHCQLGVIIPCLLHNTTSIVQQEKDPNVLTLSSNGSTSIWFPLLPIITPGSGNVMSGKQPQPTTTSVLTETEKDIRSFE